MRLTKGVAVRPTATYIERYKANYRRAHRRNSRRAWHWVVQYARAAILIGEGA